MKENFEKLRKSLQMKESIGDKAENVKNTQQSTEGYGMGGFLMIGAEK
jgi:hypothetical protein